MAFRIFIFPLFIDKLQTHSMGLEPMTSTLHIDTIGGKLIGNRKPLTLRDIQRLFGIAFENKLLSTEILSVNFCQKFYH
jgi:hypothetical protein